MVGFDYKYLTFNDILERINYIINFSTNELILITIVVIFTFITVMYLIPLYLSFNKYYKKEKEKHHKKMMLKQITMQKEIQEEIEREIENTISEKRDAR